MKQPFFTWDAKMKTILLLILTFLGLLLSACVPSSEPSKNIFSCSAIDQNNNVYKYEVRYAQGFVGVAATYNDKSQQVMILESSDYYPAKQVWVNIDDTNKYRFQTNVGMISNNGKPETEDSDLIVFYNNDKLVLTTNCSKY